MARIAHADFAAFAPEAQATWPEPVSTAAADLAEAVERRRDRLAAAAAREGSERTVGRERAALDAVASALERHAFTDPQPAEVDPLAALEELMIAAGPYGASGDAAFVDAYLRLRDALFAARR